MEVLIRCYNKIIILSIILMASNEMLAQKIDPITTDYTKERLVGKIGLLGEYISLIADSNTPRSERLWMVNKVLSMFINKGNDFVENNIKRKGVTVEVFYPDGRSNKLLLRNYLNGLANSRYQPIMINGVVLGELQFNSLKAHPTDSTLLVGTIDFNTMYKDGLFIDVSSRKVDCDIRVETIEDITDSIAISKQYIIPFGDSFGTIVNRAQK